MVTARLTTTSPLTIIFRAQDTTSRLSIPGCSVSCWAGVAVRVVALDPIPRPARAAHALVVLAVRAELHRELARRLRVALRTPLALSNTLGGSIVHLRDVQTAAGHGVAVAGVPRVPAPRPARGLGPRVAAGAALGTSRRAPGSHEIFVNPVRNIFCCGADQAQSVLEVFQ